MDKAFQEELVFRREELLLIGTFFYFKIFFMRKNIEKRITGVL